MILVDFLTGIRGIQASTAPMLGPINSEMNSRRDLHGPSVRRVSPCVNSNFKTDKHQLSCQLDGQEKVLNHNNEPNI